MFFFGVLFLMPIILLVMNAFKTHNDMIQNFLSFPHYLYTGNFTEAIERLKFWRVVGNSAYVTLGTMLVCTIIPLWLHMELRTSLESLEMFCI